MFEEIGTASMTHHFDGGKGRECFVMDQFVGRGSIAEFREMLSDDYGTTVQGSIIGESPQSQGAFPDARLQPD